MPHSHSPSEKAPTISVQPDLPEAPATSSCELPPVIFMNDTYLGPADSCTKGSVCRKGDAIVDQTWI